MTLVLLIAEHAFKEKLFQSCDIIFILICESVLVIQQLVVCNAVTHYTLVSICAYIFSKEFLTGFKFVNTGVAR